MPTPAISPEGLLSVEDGDLRLEVDPRAGGRVRSFRLGGVEALLGRDVHPTNWGSTLWTSPQADWGWPPPAEFDDVAFTVQDDPDAIALEGPPVPSLGLVLAKRFSIDIRRRAVVAEYGLRNIGATTRTVSAWEVSRVPARGVTFFPTGAAGSGPLAVRQAVGGTWYAHDPSVLDDVGQKWSADGAGGFVAHAAGRLLFVKTFVDLPPAQQAPGEGEVEVYGNDRYVEVEAQGPYAPIAPGSTAWWRVHWTLRMLPPTLEAIAGSEALLAFARQVAREMQGP